MGEAPEQGPQPKSVMQFDQALHYSLIIIIIIIIIVIIAFKGAIRDFLQSPHCAANCLQHIRSSGPGAIVCKSHATHRTPITCNMSYYCYMVRRDSSNCIYLSIILLAEPLTNEGGEETEVPGENPWR